MWDAENRGQAVGIYSLAPLLGPAIGPIAGGWIAEKSTWRWVFWSVSIADALVQVLGIFYLRESEFLFSVIAYSADVIYPSAYAPVLLKQKARRIEKEFTLDPEKGGNRVVKTKYQLEQKELK